MYETFSDAFVKSRPLDDLQVLLRSVVGKYPKCFKVDVFERQPLAENVLDQLMQREGWNADTATSLLKFYHFPMQFRSRFKAGLTRIDLDGKVVGRLSIEDAETVRETAMRQVRDAKERNDRIKNSGANVPTTLLPKVKLPPEKPAVSILSGIKEMKARLLAAATEIEAKIQDEFPEELIELFPDLERSISKLMEGAEEIIEHCKPRTNGKHHDGEMRV